MWCAFLVCFDFVFLCLRCLFLPLFFHPLIGSYPFTKVCLLSVLLDFEISIFVVVVVIEMRCGVVVC